MKNVTIKNRFHNTEATLRVSDENFQEVEHGNEHLAFVKLSESQVKRADKTLCGMKDCMCGGINRAGQLVNRNEWVFTIE